MIILQVKKIKSKLKFLRKKVGGGGGGGVKTQNL